MTFRLALIGFIFSTFSMSLLAHAQERVVSLGGDVTEIIYALGEGDRIPQDDVAARRS